MEGLQNSIVLHDTIYFPREQAVYCRYNCSAYIDMKKYPFQIVFKEEKCNFRFKLIYTLSNAHKIISHFRLAQSEQNKIEQFIRNIC